MEDWHGGMEWQLTAHSTTWSMCTSTFPRPWGNTPVHGESCEAQEAQRQDPPYKHILLVPPSWSGPSLSRPWRQWTGTHRSVVNPPHDP